MRRLLSWLVAAPALSTCSGAAPPPHERPLPAQITLAQFQLLRWLQGTWRGTATGTAPVYQSYVFIDDSTVRGFSYRDSTFAQASDSSIIAWRSGLVRDTGAGQVWIATRLDSTGARFAPEADANRFTWTQESRDRWTALLEWPDSAAAHPPRTYLMERVGH
jgi:hypothetical protein